MSIGRWPDVLAVCREFHRAHAVYFVANPTEVKAQGSAERFISTLAPRARRPGVANMWLVLEAWNPSVCCY